MFIIFIHSLAIVRLGGLLWIWVQSWARFTTSPLDFQGPVRTHWTPLEPWRLSKYIYTVDPHLLRLICNPQVYTHEAFAVMYRVVEKWKIWVTGCAHSQLRLAKASSVFLFLFSSDQQVVSFWSIQCLCFAFAFLCLFFFFWMMILLFKMSPKFIIEVLSDVPKGKKLALCLTGKNTCTG